MELALIVYLIEFLDKVDGIALALGIPLVVTVLMLSIISCAEGENCFSVIPKPSWKYIKMAFGFIAIALILPSEKTAYKMLAAYAGTEVIKMEETQEIGGKAYKALNKVIDDYLGESK